MTKPIQFRVTKPSENGLNRDLALLSIYNEPINVSLRKYLDEHPAVLSFDELISLHEEKLEMLKLYRRGVTEKLAVKHDKQYNLLKYMQNKDK